MKGKYVNHITTFLLTDPPSFHFYALMIPYVIFSQSSIVGGEENLMP